MPERFKRRGGVAKSLRGIAVAEIDAALAAISDAAADEAETIHTVRQQLKRLRALIRLPHRSLAGYHAENAAFRDLARRLARTRDEDVLGETFDALAAKAEIVSPRLRAEVTRTTGPRRAPEGRDVLLHGDIAAGLLAARRRVRDWRFDAAGFRLIGPGLRRVYKQMRTSEEQAAAHPTPEHFHAWRKQTKYHGNQLALLGAVAPKIFKGYRKIAEKLGTTLGEHHDLDALAAALLQLGDTSQGKRRRLLAAIHAHNARLEARCFRLGHELTTERPDDFLRRIEVGWESWRD